MAPVKGKLQAPRGESSAARWAGDDSCSCSQILTKMHGRETTFRQPVQLVGIHYLGFYWGKIWRDNALISKSIENPSQSIYHSIQTQKQKVDPLLISAGMVVNKWELLYYSYAVNLSCS